MRQYPKHNFLLVVCCKSILQIIAYDILTVYFVTVSFPDTISSLITFISLHMSTACPFQSRHFYHISSLWRNRWNAKKACLIHWTWECIGKPLIVEWQKSFLKDRLLIHLVLQTNVKKNFNDTYATVTKYLNIGLYTMMYGKKPNFVGPGVERKIDIYVLSFPRQILSSHTPPQEMDPTSPLSIKAPVPVHTHTQHTLMPTARTAIK